MSNSNRNRNSNSDSDDSYTGRVMLDQLVMLLGGLQYLKRHGALVEYRYLYRKVRIHSAPSLLVELGSDVAARGEPPRFTPSCCKATMLHAASLDGAVC
jgi:hypothetical protein